MSARIINFPLNGVLPTFSFYGFFPETHRVESKGDLSVFQTDKVCSDKHFDEIIKDEELAKEMFPPDYFMLVE